MNAWILWGLEDEIESSGTGALVAWAFTPWGQTVLALVAIACGLGLLVPPRGQGKLFVLGSCLTALGTAILLVPTLTHISPSISPAMVYALMEGLAVLGGLGTILSRSPVYSAIWFASALLAIGALLLLSGAQFLGLATVAVYAGAIVVTFLFVLMLAQPEGHAVYDRTGWGTLPTCCAVLAGCFFLGVVVSSLLESGDAARRTDELRVAVETAVADVVRDQLAATATPDLTKRFTPGQTLGVVRRAQLQVGPTSEQILRIDLANDVVSLVSQDHIASRVRSHLGDRLTSDCRIDIQTADILTTQHVARLGQELYGRHLVAVQVAGVLLLIALIGAIAMAIHGNAMVVPFPLTNSSDRGVS